MNRTLPALRSYVAALVRRGEGGAFTAEEAKLLLAALDAQAVQADPGSTLNPEPASAEVPIPALNRIVPTWDTVNPGHLTREGVLVPCYAVLRDRAGEVQGAVYRLDRGWFAAWMGGSGRFLHREASSPLDASAIVNQALWSRMAR